MRASLLLAALLASVPAAAQTLRGRYTPSFQTFSCELPAADWQAFEDEEAAGPVARFFAPDSPASVYRAGLSVRLVEKGQPGFVPWKEAVDRLRRREKGRGATALRTLRVPGALARVLEVTETRWLPEDRLPAEEEKLHHYVAVLPSGDGYFLIKLSSTQESYLRYRETFVKFLKGFRALGPAR